ncbi:MAG: amidohydrolase [Proteobacteria bacterium]|nr:amidohydrolase [Pseudomonadota bacterium]
MSRRAWIAAAVLVGIGAAAFLLARGPGPRLYLGGPILTMDANDTVAEALAVEGDRIVAVGDEAELRAWTEREGAEVVDLAGRALLPGFIDAHGHFPGEGLTALHVDVGSPPVGTVEKIDDVLERLRARAAETSSGDWILGIGYDDTLLAEMRHPTRADLDRASEDHPIALLHVSGHLATTNSAALRELGIDAATPDPEGGVIRRDPETGEPDGVLEETAAEGLTAQLLQPSLLEAVTMVRAAGERAVRAGVTTVQSGFTPKAQIQGLHLLSRLGLVPVRLVIWPDPDAADALLDESFSFSSYDEDWVRLGAVKLVADGSIQGYTGYLSEPYHVPPGDDPGYRGYPRISRDELLESVPRYHAAGLQVAVHGNGDASIDDILDAFEAAQAAAPREDARPIVIHAQMVRDDQLDRMAALGAIPSFFSLHTYYWGDRHRDRFMGPQRASRMSPARSAAARGLHFTIHCDAPVVPMEPLRLVWSAVNRRSTSGASIGAAERIAPIQALRAVTIEAARQHFEEDRKGSLEPGKLADLVILSRSPLDDPETIDEIQVLETIVGGETVYRAPRSTSRPGRGGSRCPGS